MEEEVRGFGRERAAQAQAKDENARLRRIVADLTLDKQILQEGSAKKTVKAVKRRELAAWITMLLQQPYGSFSNFGGKTLP